MATAKVKHINVIHFRTCEVMDMGQIKQHIQKYHNSDYKVFVGDYSVVVMDNLKHYHVEYILVKL